ncbi:hypothetical protein BHE74_00019875, partial [Ensete ventricosum]
QQAFAADDHGGRQAKSSEAFKRKTRSQFTQCTIYVCCVVLFPKKIDVNAIPAKLAA